MTDAVRREYAREMPAFVCLRESWPKARKEHACAAECSAPIRPGEVHYLFVYVEEGSLHAKRYHTRCWLWEEEPAE